MEVIYLITAKQKNKLETHSNQGMGNGGRKQYGQ